MLYGGSFLLLSLIVGFVAIRPRSFLPDDVDFFAFVLFWAMMLPQFMSLDGMSGLFEREKRARLIFSLPLKARDFIFGVWLIIIMMMVAPFALGMSFAVSMRILKDYSLFNTVLGLNGLFLALTGLGPLFYAVERTTRWFKPFRRIAGIAFFVTLFGAIIFSDNALDPLLTAMFKTNGIIFLHLLGVFFMLASYSGLKRISPVR